MKELTIEQKARAYDKAIEKARKLATDLPNGRNDRIYHIWDLESIFPELRESEDERIRKELIEFVKSRGGFKQEYIAWLEKQGKHSIYNVPSREVILAIWDLGNEWKELTNGSISTEYGTQLDYIQKHWHESEYYLREKQREQKSTDKVEPKFKVGDKVIGIVSDMQYYITDVCYDHYYTESGCIIMFCSQDNFKLVEQKPAWSEEDEKIRQTIINEFKQCSEWYCSNGLTKEDCINWLNKQEYFEWGDEDNENMNSLCVLLDQMVSINAIGNEHSIEYKNWLKSIKQKIKGE